MQRVAMSARRSFLSLFLAVLLAVRLASPFGFMPGEANGRLALVECPDAIPIPSAHHGMHHDGGAKAKPTCPFAAGMAPAGPLPQVAAVEGVVGWPFEAAVTSAVPALPSGARIAPRPPSRAPPRA